jgi:hypothetical protein
MNIKILKSLYIKHKSENIVRDIFNIKIYINKIIWFWKLRIEKSLLYLWCLFLSIIWAKFYFVDIWRIKLFERDDFPKLLSIKKSQHQASN